VKFKSQSMETVTQGSSESEIITSLFRFALFTPGRRYFAEIRKPAQNSQFDLRIGIIHIVRK
jgi:hypothetical protein